MLGCHCGWQEEECWQQLACICTTSHPKPATLNPKPATYIFRRYGFVGVYHGCVCLDSRSILPVVLLALQLVLDDVPGPAAVGQALGAQALKGVVGGVGNGHQDADVAVENSRHTLQPGGARALMWDGMGWGKPAPGRHGCRLLGLPVIE